MDANPQQPPSHQTVIVNQQESNSLGLAGFIVSLAGWLTCGLLCPVGFLLSLCALGKRPRGFAIAGVIVGLPGAIFLGVFGLGFILALFGGVMGPALSRAQESANMIRAKEAILGEYQATSSLPDESRAQEIFTNELGWEDQLATYSRNSDSQFTITTPGPDRQFGTDDDWENTLAVDGSQVYDLADSAEIPAEPSAEQEQKFDEPPVDPDVSDPGTSEGG